MKLTLFLMTLLATPALFAQTYANPVREVDRPEKAAVSGRCDFDMTGSLSQSCTIYTPAAGKRLVVEHLSVGCTMPAASASEVAGGYFHTFLTNQPAVATPLVLRRIAYSGFVNRVYVTSQPVRLYSDARQPVSVSLFRSDGQAASFAQCTTNFSGYLVNVP